MAPPTRRPTRPPIPQPNPQPVRPSASDPIRVDEAHRADLAARFALEVDRRGRTYSSGNRQKVALVAAFASRAPLLVLDEPTNGLDPLMEREFRTCVAEARDRGQTVFLSSHQLSEVEAVCDRCS